MKRLPFAMFTLLTVRPATWLALGLWACLSGAQAQDSFDGKAPAVRPPPPPTQPAPSETQRPSGNPGPNTPPPASTGESQDFGVRPVSQLRPTDQLHGPTPTAIPGGRVVSTQQLAQWMQGQQGPQGRVMLLHTVASQRHLPNAIPAAPASQGGRFDDPVPA